MNPIVVAKVPDGVLALCRHIIEYVRFALQNHSSIKEEDQGEEQRIY
jgi:hypothetical protein